MDAGKDPPVPADALCRSTRQGTAAPGVAWHCARDRRGMVGAWPGPSVKAVAWPCPWPCHAAVSAAHTGGPS